MREDNGVKLWSPTKRLEVEDVGVVMVEFMLEAVFHSQVIGESDVQQDNIFLQSSGGKRSVC